MLLTVKETAGRLRVGAAYVRDLLHNGTLKNVGLPGRRSFRIDSTDVERLILASKLGSVTGTESEIQPAQSDENAAPNPRRPRRHLKAVNGGKYQWMKGFSGGARDE